MKSQVEVKLVCPGISFVSAFLFFSLKKINNVFISSSGEYILLMFWFCSEKRFFVHMHNVYSLVTEVSNIANEQWRSNWYEMEDEGPISSSGALILVFNLRPCHDSRYGGLLSLSLYVFAVMCPLYAYHQSHPLNLILLGLFTVTISLSVGISCSLAPSKEPLSHG